MFYFYSHCSLLRLCVCVSSGGSNAVSMLVLVGKVYRARGGCTMGKGLRLMLIKSSVFEHVSTSEHQHRLRLCMIAIVMCLLATCPLSAQPCASAHRGPCALLVQPQVAQCDERLLFGSCVFVSSGGRLLKNEPPSLVPWECLPAGPDSSVPSRKKKKQACISNYTPSECTAASLTPLGPVRGVKSVTVDTIAPVSRVLGWRGSPVRDSLSIRSALLCLNRGRRLFSKLHLSQCLPTLGFIHIHLTLNCTNPTDDMLSNLYVHSEDMTMEN